MVEKTQRLLACVEELERLKQCWTPYEEFYFQERVGYLKRSLTEALESAGSDALIGSRYIVEKSKPILVESELRMVRVKLIDIFLTRKASAKNDEFLYDYASSLRRRMQLQEKQINTEELHPISFKKFIRSESGKIAFGVTVFILWIAIALQLYEYIAEMYPKIKSYLSWGLWAITLMAYAWGAKRTWASLSDSLNNLVEPNKKSGKAKSAIVTKYIAAAFLVGFTIMCALLLFDYLTHSAAADLGDRKEKAVAEIERQNFALWRIKAGSLENVNIESSFNADFGSYAGTFGDFFGGVLNPILTFGTLLALAITILMQRSQLIDEKSHADKSAQVSNLQSFETTFFNLLNLHNATIAGLSLEANSLLLPREKERVAAQVKAGKLPIIVNPHPGATGRSVFALVLSLMNEMCDRADKYDPLERHITEPLDIYKIIQSKHNSILGHYFRNLYQALAFVDHYSTPLTNGDHDVEHKVRKRYTNILRAQLSSHELSTLFYNCLDRIVDSGSFRALLIEYAFLEHMSLEYIYLTHELRIRGYSSSITHKIEQYLGMPIFLTELTGAFGENPEIAEYVIMQEIYRDG